MSALNPVDSSGSNLNAMETATNVVCQPQGGVTRRAGLRYINALPNTGTESAANGVRLIAFEFSTSDSYMLCFTHNRMYVYKNGSLVTNINGTGLPYLNTSSVALNSAKLATMCWTQSADTLIVVHEDLWPVKIVRGSTDATWTANAISFDSGAKYAYSIRYLNPVGNMTPSDMTGKVTLTAAQAATTGTAQAGSSTTITLAAADAQSAGFYVGQFIHLTGGTGSGQYNQIIAYVATTKVATVATAWTTNPSSGTTYSIAVFKENAVGQYINASPQGRAKILSVTSDTVANAIVEFPFFNKNALAAGQCEIETGYENVWSVARGWPKTVTFHEGRLYFGGSKSRPSTIWGSKVGLFFEFYATEGLDDDAVEATLDTNTFNAITDMISGRDLQIFTTGGEFFVQQSTTEPITPLNFNVKAVSKHGSKTGVRVQALDSGTLFIQRQGKSLNEFAFSDTQATYLTSKISLLSGHLLNGPKTMSLRKAVNTDENDLLLIVNSDDGTMAAYSLLKAENIIAASKFTTDGLFIDVGVDITTIYTVVQRTISGTTQYFVERFDETLLTDCSVTGTTSSTISASHLIGKSVDIVLDDVPQPRQTVPGGGTLTFARTPTATSEVGLPINIRVVTMPADLKIQTGTRIGFKKRIVEVHALVLETQNLVINNIQVPFRAFDTAGTLDAAVQAYTGTKVLHGILGYSQEVKLTITQSAPLKMTLLGMEYKISVHQGT